MANAPVTFSKTMLGSVLLLLLPLLIAFWNFFWKRRGLPPGPTPFPIFGNTLAFCCSSSFYLPFKQWAQEYGPIFTFWQGETPVVTITDYALMHEMLVKEGDAFAGREFLSELSAVSDYQNGKFGVTQTQGTTWKVLRRFGLKSMRNLGVGRAGMEKQFISDISKMIKGLGNELGGEAGVEMDLQKHVDRLIGSIINRVLFGFAFDEEHFDEFRELKGTLDKMSRWQMEFRPRLLFASPWLRHLPIFRKTFAEFNEFGRRIYDYLGRHIKARIEERKKMGEGKEAANLVDCFLEQIEMAEKGELGEEGSQEFTLENIYAICFDLFLAGQETTATTLNFLILYLMLNPGAQQKLHGELDELEAEKGDNGGNGPIGLADRPRLHFVNAVEVQRKCNLFPVNLSHKTICEVEIMGGKYRLKEGTVILPQISCVLNDEKIFPNPGQFIPERFLDENGKLKKCEELVPFGLGKRVCMGESLARMELFLFTANFFKHFRVHPVDPQNPPSTVKEKAFVVRVAPYKCRISLRKDLNGNKVH